MPGTPRTHYRFTSGDLAAIDQVRRELRLQSRSEAIRAAIALALRSLGAVPESLAAGQPEATETPSR